MMPKRIAALGITTALAIGTLSINYKGLEIYTHVTKESPTAPGKQELRQDILQRAQSLLGKSHYSPNHPGGYACTDVYVKSVPGLEEMLEADYNALKDPTVRYSLFDRRLWDLPANLKRIFSGTYKNTPSNPFFTRRIQNVLPFQQAHGVAYELDEIIPQPGMAIYWKRGVFNFPSHMGVIEKVINGKVTRVIHASESKEKVVSVPHQEVLDGGFTVHSFGDVPVKEK